MLSHTKLVIAALPFQFFFANTLEVKRRAGLMSFTNTKAEFDSKIDICSDCEADTSASWDVKCRYAQSCGLCFCCQTDTTSLDVCGFSGQKDDNDDEGEAAETTEEDSLSSEADSFSGESVQLNRGMCEQNPGPLRAVPEGACRTRVSPNLLFIGQAHSGSTSLSSLLDLHPQIDLGDMKEHHFFDKDMKSTNARSASTADEYLDQFCVSCNTTVAMDGTQEYINLAYEEYGGKRVVENIKSLLGANIKIMMMIRDPVDLLFSENHAFTTDDVPNITRSQISVVEPLRIWLEVFPDRKNWLFLDSAQWFATPTAVMDKVFNFLGVSPFEVDMDAEDHYGHPLFQSGRRRSSNKASLAQRQAYWSMKSNREDRMQLEKLTGLSFSAWTRDVN